MANASQFLAGQIQDDSWRTPIFRQKVVTQIEEAMRQSGDPPITKTSVEMEEHVFQKAKSRDEYLALVARLIIHVRDIKEGEDPVEKLEEDTQQREQMEEKKKQMQEQKEKLTAQREKMRAETEKLKAEMLQLRAAREQMMRDSQQQN